jgi:hypothetical protein
MTEQTPLRNRSAATEDRIGKWAIGITFFAAIVMLLAGTAQFFTGLSAVLGNVPYAFTTGNQLFEFSLAAWGWIHLVVGLAVGAAGAALLAGQRWARAVAIIFLLFSVISNFLFIPQNPFWTLSVIALDVLVIWALTAHPRDASF